MSVSVPPGAIALTPDAFRAIRLGRGFGEFTDDGGKRGDDDDLVSAASRVTSSRQMKIRRSRRAATRDSSVWGKLGPRTSEFMMPPRAHRTTLLTGAR